MNGVIGRGGDVGGEEGLVLNYLQVKNDILLSYLIDLSLLLRHRLSASSSSSSKQQQRQQKIESCQARLQETKVILERIRPMEKKMRYQIDKLLALSTVIHSANSDGSNTGEAGMFAAVGREKELAEETEKMEGDYAKDGTSNSSNDPLSFKPDLQGMLNMFDNHDDNDEDGDDNSDKEVKDYDGSSNKIFLEKKDDNNNTNNIYQPPRHQSMPFDYNIDSTNQERLHYKKQEQINKQRSHALQSELTSIIKSSILTNDQPDEEDVHGGALVGYQSNKSRKVIAHEKEVQEYEE